MGADEVGTLRTLQAYRAIVDALIAGPSWPHLQYRR